MQIDFSNPWAAIITLGAILAALAVIVKTAVLPVVKASKVVNKRWDAAGEVDEIKDVVKQILEAIRPTNGDQRSISERVDTAKKAAQAALEKSQATHDEFTQYQLHESRERQYRQRDHERERKEIISRLSQLEVRQTDLVTRQTNLSTRITTLDSKVDTLLIKVDKVDGGEDAGE